MKGYWVGAALTSMAVLAGYGIISANTGTPPRAPVSTLATFAGSGVKNTPDFTVPNEWVLKWTYDCGNFGSPGNFQVFEYRGDGSLADLAVNELGKAGKGVTNEHVDAGVRYFKINSECAWTVTAKG